MALSKRLAPLLLLAFTSSLAAQSSEPRLWQSDVDQLLRAIDSIHPSPYRHVSRDALTQAGTALRDSLPRMTPTQAVAGFARLIAMIGDGHSRLGHVQLPNHARPVLTLLAVPGFDRIYPIEVEFFSDGLRVVATTPEAEALLGGRVTSIAGVAAKEAGRRLTPFIAHDNEQWVYYTLPVYLRHPGYLSAAGLIPRTDAPLAITVERNGTTVTRSLAPAAADSIRWATAHPGARAPLWATLQENYSIRRLSDSVLYFRYRQVQHQDGFPVAAFAERLSATMDSMPLKRLVIDIRRNAGGNGYLNQPIIHALIRHPRLRAPGSIVVLIDRGTFSAAIMLAKDVEHHVFAPFVGEPVSSPPNHPGDPARVTLAASGLLVRISSLFWQLSDMRDRRPAIIPDVLVAPTFDDWMQGRDPVLDAALRLEASSIEWPQQPNMNWGRRNQARSRYAAAVQW